jgi:hypothetical protein
MTELVAHGRRHEHKQVYRLGSRNGANSYHAQRGHPFPAASFSRPLHHFALALAPVPPRLPHTIVIRVRGRSTATRIAKSPEEFSETTPARMHNRGDC